VGTRKGKTLGRTLKRELNWGKKREQNVQKREKRSGYLKPKRLNDSNMLRTDRVGLGVEAESKIWAQWKMGGGKIEKKKNIGAEEMRGKNME